MSDFSKPPASHWAIPLSPCYFCLGTEFHQHACPVAYLANGQPVPGAEK
jgi:hypothetical protein